MVISMDENLKRMENESDDQYFYRVCNMKEALGFTWPQMAQIFNDEFGCNKTESAYRKTWAAFKNVFEANSDKIVGEDKYLEEIKKAKYELEKERQKLYATKVEANRSLRFDSREELFYENIRDAIQTLTMPKVIAGNSDYLIDYNREYVLTIADIQAGANFEIETNEYSLSICEERFNKLLGMLVKYIQFNNISKFYIIDIYSALNKFTYFRTYK